MRLVTHLVARIEWAEHELDQIHVVRVQVVFHEDEEQLASLEAPAQVARTADMVPDLPVKAVMVVPLPLDIRRSGRYWVRLSVDGEELKALPLSVEITLPQL